MFDARFAAACRGASSPSETFDVVGRGLAHLVPGRPAEVLLGDGLTSELRVVTRRGPDGIGPGCPVNARLSCPAIRTGRIQVSVDSRALDACAHLRDRDDEPCAGVCAPVVRDGLAVGVVHVTSGVDRPLSHHEVASLDDVARLTGEHLAALEKGPQLDAGPRPAGIAGLASRSVFEDRVRVLQATMVEFSIAVVGIDQAGGGITSSDARAVAEVVAACEGIMRPEDLVTGLGDGELAMIFPRAEAAQAVGVLERIRRSVLERWDGAGDHTTRLSFGLASSLDGWNLDEILLVADQALYRARQAGGDRIVIAGAAVQDVEDPDELPLG